VCVYLITCDLDTSTMKRPTPSWAVSRVNKIVVVKIRKYVQYH
jgi:hypothetical protein